MQKKLIALAVAGLSTAAIAQTNVTIYGVADVSAQGTNVSQSNAVSSQPTGGLFDLKSNSSLIGFKGTEDLGNGLKGLFQMETNVNMTGNGTSGQNGPTTSGNMFTSMRDSYVGASSKYGTVMGGYLSTPYRSALNSFDVMPGATGDGRIENIMGTVQLANATTGAAGTQNTAGTLLKSSVRATALAYALPTMYGFNGSLAYTGSANTLDNQAYGTAPAMRSALSLNLGWDGYGFGIKGAFQQAGFANNQALTTAAAGIQGYTNYLVGVQYTGVPGLKAAVVYGRNTLGVNNNGTAGSAKGSNNQIWAGASYRFGNNEPRLSYVNSGNVSGLDNATSPNVYAGQTGATQWTANWGYYLSKRTQVYGLVSGISNRANGTYNMASGGTNVVLNGGQDVLTYGMGMRTNF
ncbi:MAG: porin [Fluviibacter sp.]